ncbi:MAG: sensor histidine kinase [Lachnospiraceae bacterium]|nr:sensor histidine kinase [Lachnospiraceae bacterium]
MIDNEAVQAVADILMVVEILITAYCIYRFAKPFMNRKKGAFFSGVAYVLIMLILYSIPLPLYALLVYGIKILVVLLMMCLIDRRNYEQKVFLVVTFFSLRRFALVLAEILYDHLYNWATQTQYMMEHPNMWFALYVGVSVLYQVFEFSFMAIAICMILRTYLNKYAQMTKKEMLMLILPSFAMIAGSEIMHYYRSFYILKTGEASGAYDLLSFLYYAISVVPTILLILLYQKIRAKQEEKLQRELLAAQMDNIRQHIMQVETLYQNIRGIRHDMTNHILTLERLYAGNQQKEARAYSADLKASLTAATEELKSGNPVTDVILQEQKNEAQKKKIHFNSDFHYPSDSAINAFDISVILNNALQNALENAKTSDIPYVSIRSYRRNNAYMIEVNNSFKGNLQWNPETGLPLTSKRETDGHGYGLSNIRKVAEKYSGDIAIDIKENQFRLTIMLMTE